MSVKQNNQVVPPVPGDRGLANFASIIQANMRQLFGDAHIHKIVTAAPAANDGTVGDIYLGDLSAGKVIYVKFSDGWYVTASLTKV